MIVLVGFMGSGKSSVGRLLAAKLGLPFVDTDSLIEARAGRPIKAIFKAEGERGFRVRESEVVGEVLQDSDSVVALGGGAVTDPATRTALEWAEVVHLEVGYGEAMRRVGADPGRPMLGVSDPKALFEERSRIYKAVARRAVSTEGRSPDEIALEIASWFTSSVDADLDRIVVSAPSRRYDVVVGSGLVAKLDELLPELPDAESALLITHDSLRLFAEEAAGPLRSRGLKVEVLIVPEGEASKSLESAFDLYRRLAEQRAHREDLIVGVGGGVVTDLAGFVASTFNRGMPVVHVATTLLAQVDAAIGGKTGVNLAAAKNLVGTIQQPICVVCDVDHLRTLPEPELRSGLAEVVKYGLIAEPDLLDYVSQHASEILARDPQVLRTIVARSAAIKAAIVSVDEREHGIRAHLNYGHTFGHAIEAAAGYSGIRHGEAISLGMMAAAHLARALGWIDESVVDAHRNALSSVGLPVRGSLDFASLEGAWAHDKKYRRGLRFVLLKGLGLPEAGVEVSPELMRAALERMSA